MATSTSGALQINIKSVNANPFGLYICQLNASGVIFQKSSIIKEQGNDIRVNHNDCGLSIAYFVAAFLMMIIDIEDFNECSSIDVSLLCPLPMLLHGFWSTA